MTKDEALKLALDALEEINKLSIGENAICLPAGIDTAMDAIKQVLAQQEYQGSDAAKAAHMMDLYEALGVKWGDDPFSAIAKLREAHPEQEPKKIPESWATHGGLWIEALYKHQRGE